MARRFSAWKTQTSKRSFPSIRRRTITYGRSPQVDLEIQNVRLAGNGSDFTIRRRARNWADSDLNVPGLHNVLNATAAIGVGLELEVSTEHLREGLEAFSGVDRRFSVRGVRERRHGNG